MTERLQRSPLVTGSPWIFKLALKDCSFQTWPPALAYARAVMFISCPACKKEIPASVPFLAVAGFSFTGAYNHIGRPFKTAVGAKLAACFWFRSVFLLVRSGQGGGLEAIARPCPSQGKIQKSVKSFPDVFNHGGPDGRFISWGRSYFSACKRQLPRLAVLCVYSLPLAGSWLAGIPRRRVKICLNHL